MRKIKFENDKYYHIYNRGVDKRDVFCNQKDYIRFIRSMRKFNVLKPIGSLYAKSKEAQKDLTPFKGVKSLQSSLVEIICYCLNPNHFHLILKQLTENGIAEFMKRLAGGYACYFNLQYQRFGSLFQGLFKAVYVNTAKYLTWLSGYVNGNVEIHRLAKAKDYPWSSYQDYLDVRNGTLCNKKIVLEQFNNNITEYKEFVKTVVNDSQARKESIKEYLADLES